MRKSINPKGLLDLRKRIKWKNKWPLCATMLHIKERIYESYPSLVEVAASWSAREKANGC